VDAIAFPGDTDTHAFLTYAQQVLVSNLWHDACIEAAGARLVDLSLYSPELSPIENYWSKLKESLCF
jgi:transposase